MRQTAQRVVNAGEFSVLYLWVKFYANGGNACTSELEGFLHGKPALSHRDVEVLDDVIQHLRNS